MLRARLRNMLFRFKTPGQTSRGVLHDKPSWFISIENVQTGVTGIGECSVIPGLSPEYDDNYRNKLQELVRQINDNKMPPLADYDLLPSIRFGFETALRDMNEGGNRVLFPSAFTDGLDGIRINGLVWMGDIKKMEKQVRDKLKLGFKCLKLKVGALDFNTEIKLLENLREEFKVHDLEIRLDANGAFQADEALEKLKKLSEFHIHSLEQPIKQGQWEEMARICELSPVPVALDEELIGRDVSAEGEKIIDNIRPGYIILKPSLLGGFEKCTQWISHAEKMGTGWWITSALESNIGLNAIAQWTYTMQSSMAQGLGTGQVFQNNISSPLSVKGQYLHYDPIADWDTGNILE